jgi:ubiquinone biosynthesis protein
VYLKLPKTVRSIRRVQTIARVLTHHGFGHLVDKLHLERYVPLPKRWRPVTTAALATEPDSSLGRRIALVCEELGPSFVKLGQMLSSRPDVVSSEIVNELVKLQDKVPPFDTDQARRIIEDELGASVNECFASFDAQPFASGSIAQVYRATTKGDGDKLSRRVVVKVKRPGIEDMVRLDMTILRWIADLAERLVPEMSNYRPNMIVDEFERTMFREMDFINEAATISRFAEVLGDQSDIRIPEVYWELTGPNVLTLEEIQGLSIQTIISNADRQFDRKAIAERVMRSFIHQFFEIGLFHGDPHPGNLLVEPPASIGLIDFGLTGQIEDDQLGRFVVALVAAFNRESGIIVEVLADMDAIGDETDRQQLRRDLTELIDKYYGLPLNRFDFQTLFYEVTGIIRRNDVTLPREFVLLGKALVGVGGICLQLDPQLDIVALVKPKINSLIAGRLDPARLLKTAAISGWHILSILKNAPGQLRDITRRLACGRWQVNIRHQNIDDLANEIDRASNRLVFAVIIASIIVGSSWVLSTESTAVIPLLGIPLPVLGIVGYMVAGIMGLWLVIAILRSGKLS